MIMIDINSVFTEALRDFQEYVPLIVTHNHITTFEELVDTEKTQYPKAMASVRDYAIDFYNSGKDIIQSFIDNIVSSGITEEEVIKCLEMDGLNTTI